MTMKLNSTEAMRERLAAQNPLESLADDLQYRLARQLRFIGQPSSEIYLQDALEDELTDQGWHVGRERAEGTSRYDLVCYHGQRPKPEILIEVKMRLTKTHYRQIDRYLLAAPGRPLLVATWSIARSARPALDRLAREHPARFQYIVLGQEAAALA